MCFDRSLELESKKNSFLSSTPTMSTKQSSTIDTEDPSVTRFRQYLRIKTVQPNPDYKSCNEFLSQIAKEMKLEFQSIEVRRRQLVY